MGRQIVNRILICIVLGLATAFVVNEFFFLFIKSAAGRGPETITLVIPPGTAQRIAQGQTTPGIPASQVFVVGDTLVVKNEDSVAHKLGPLFVPSGTSASLKLDVAQNQTFSCSFYPTKTFGIDVQEPVTFITRLTGILFAAFPLSVLFVVYGFLVRPLKTEVKVLEEVKQV